MLKFVAKATAVTQHNWVKCRAFKIKRPLVLDGAVKHLGLAIEWPDNVKSRKGYFSLRANDDFLRISVWGRLRNLQAFRKPRWYTKSGRLRSVPF